MAESKEVTFKTISSEVFKYTFPVTTPISEIKKKIFDDKGEAFAVDLQKLIYNGKVLEDTQILGDINVDEKKYIVVMVSRKKTEQPAVPQTSSSSNVEAAKATTPAPSTEASSTAASQPAPTVTQAPTASADAPVGNLFGMTSEQEEEKITLITAMGYSRDEVVRALRAAFGDADRAVEYLCTGIPAQPDEAVAAENVADALEQESGDEADPLTFLRDSPQFAQICQLVRSQPDMLPQVLNQISNSNPELFQIIRENQEAFVQLLNQEAEGNEQGGEAPVAEEGQQAHEAGHMTIAVTETDRAAIQRLQSMGFPEQLVIEGYFACNKDENLAVNYILSRMDEQE